LSSNNSNVIVLLCVCLLKEFVIAVKYIENSSSESKFRNYELKDAIERAKAYLASQRIKYDICVITDNDSPVYTAITNCGVSSAGKGYGLQSLASCLFELIEHHSFNNLNQTLLLEEIDIRSRELIQSRAFRDDKITKEFFSDNIDCLIACVEYLELIDSSRLYRPKFMLDINYRESVGEVDLSSIRKYSSSMGVASGCDFEESLYHGICEVIEHDGTSRFLEDVYLRKNIIINRVDFENSLDQVKHLKESVENEISKEIVVFETINAFSIPSFIAILKDNIFDIGISGAGASYCRVNAVERAILELKQDYCIRTEHYKESDEESKEMTFLFQRIPAYLSCCRLLFNEIEELNTIQLTKIRSIDLKITDLTFSLSEVVKAIYDKNEVVYYKKLVDHDLASVTSIFITGTSNFSLVRGGVPIIPRY